MRAFFRDAFSGQGAGVQGVHVRSSRFIYFIESGWGGCIKIGCAFNPQARLDTLQCGNPDELHLLAVFPGDLREESALHQRFRLDCVTGEWFAPSPALWALVKEHWCYDARHGERDPQKDYRTLLEVP